MCKGYYSKGYYGGVAECSFEDKFSDFEEIFSKIIKGLLANAPFGINF